MTTRDGSRHGALQGWPLVEVDARHLDRGAGHDAAFGALAAALEVGERFAAVILPPDEARQGAGDSANRLGHLRWLKANRTALGERCAGIAFVLPGELRGRQTKLLAVGGKVLGCPVTACDSPEEARGWTRQRLAQSAARDRSGGAA